jgi:hypothetical protein
MNKPHFIATLTSYPARIKTVNITINSLLKQTLQADLIVLYLGYDKFPHKEKDLPDDLLIQTNQGLSIHWVKDIGCFTTLVPALIEFPDNVIINVDDDIDYSPQLFELLYNSYLKDTTSIHSMVARHILFYKKNFITPYNKWEGWHGSTKEPSYHNFIISTLGTLYPPRSLHKDVLDIDLAFKLSPSNDDLWFWAQALRNGTHIRVAENAISSANYIPGTQEEGLFQTNLKGINDNLIKNMLRFYPEIYDILNTEPLKIVQKKDKVIYLFHKIPLAGFRSIAYNLYDIFLFNLILLPFIKVESTSSSFIILIKFHEKKLNLFKLSKARSKLI